MNRSPWRTFLTVFLVVFLSGLGVSGAAALWSMQTNVTAGVATGTWDPSPTPTPSETSSPWNAGIRVVREKDRGDRLLEVTWNPAPRSTNGTVTTYRATLQGTEGFMTVASGTVETNSYTFPIHHDQKNDKDVVYTVTVTARTSGKDLTPASYTFRVHSNGDIIPVTG